MPLDISCAAWFAEAEVRERLGGVGGAGMQLQGDGAHCMASASPLAPSSAPALGSRSCACFNIVPLRSVPPPPLLAPPSPSPPLGRSPSPWCSPSSISARRAALPPRRTLRRLRRRWRTRECCGPAVPGGGGRNYPAGMNWLHCEAGCPLVWVLPALQRLCMCTRVPTMPACPTAAPQVRLRAALHPDLIQERAGAGRAAGPRGAAARILHQAEPQHAGVSGSMRPAACAQRGCSYWQLRQLRWRHSSHRW